MLLCCRQRCRRCGHKAIGVTAVTSGLNGFEYSRRVFISRPGVDAKVKRDKPQALSSIAPKSYGKLGRN